LKYFVVICLLIFSVRAFAQEEVSVTEVMVWVKATDRSGKVVAGLSQTDFEIFEDGKQVTLTCFEETNFAAGVAAAEPDTAQAATVASKRVAVILDVYNTHQFEYLHIKPQILDFLSQVPSGWEIMLGSVIPGSIEVIVPFTSDLKSLQPEIDRISANTQRDIEVVNRRRTILQILDRGLTTRVIEAAYRQAQEYAMEEMHMARESIKTFDQFEKHLVKWKNDSHLVVLYISGGITAEPGKQYFDLIEARLGDSDYGRRSLMGQREDGSHLWNLLRKTVAQLNRHNVTFYTINTRGNISPVPDGTIERRRELRLDDRGYLDDLQELMAELADQTGGLYFENSNNFKHGFDVILSDLDHQYLICYKAPAHKGSNETHKIKVTSKKSGLKLRHRAMYVD
jgi:VWFA-related protein